MANQFCNSCGTMLDANATFCGNCGKSVVPHTDTAQPQASPSQPSYSNPAPAYVPPVQQQTYYQPAQPVYSNAAANSETKPMSVGDYLITFIVLGIPLVGFIMSLVWAFGSNVNLNKKNYCRAYLILAIIGVILGILMSGAIIAMITSLANSQGVGNYNY